MSDSGGSLVIVVRAAGAAAERVGDKTLVVDSAGMEILTLNPVGSIVWWALDGERDVEALTDHVLGRTTSTDREVIAADVERFVAELVAAGLAVRTDADG
ncbi:PqqD family protein [Aquihabitans sp. G128]|uniref:PqqD family protein n=1 Tax=Aquihabitans sp. G128 TaxID=2849779 RepID=UPI001C246A4E|nr:PqqD family protein [Aquihabitans sp. G128]QXC61731.1 PqqD family protein [Aquihabitans sp. G128]